MNQTLKELFYLPNLISLSRLILSGVIPILWIKQTSIPIVYLLILFGALSDTLDGNLARLLKQKTNVGKVLDPIADKCFINMLFFLFYYERILPLSFFIVILARDLFILAGAFFLIFFTKGRVLPSPTFLGKLTTVFQLTTLSTFFMHHYLFALPELLLNLILNLTLFLTLSSGFYYLFIFKKMLSHA